MNGFWIALGWLNENVALAGARAAVLAGYFGAVLAVMVLAVNLLFRRWLTTSQMLLLWGLVLVRMALPVAPSSQASVHNVLIWLTSESAAREVVTTLEDAPHDPALEPATFALPAVDTMPTEVHAVVTAEGAATSAIEGCQAEELAKLLRWDLVFLADPGRVTGQVTDEAVTAAEPRTRSQEDTSEEAGNVDPEASSDRPRAELRRDGERWVIHAAGPESMHQRIRQTVHAWNRSGWGQVTVETRMAATQQNLLDAIDLDSVYSQTMSWRKNRVPPPRSSNSTPAARLSSTTP